MKPTKISRRQKGNKRDVNKCSSTECGDGAPPPPSTRPSLTSAVGQRWAGQDVGMAGQCDRAAGDSPGSLGESRDRRGDRLRSLRYSSDRPGIRPLPTSWGTGLSRAAPAQLRPGAGVGADMEPQGARWGPSSCCLHCVKLYLMSAGRFG